MEFGLRLFWHPAFLDTKHKRNDLEWLSKNVVLNRLGYRDREVSFGKVEKYLRVLSLGSSHTFGWYINDGNETYSKQMGKILKEKHKTEKIEVINASRPGYSLQDRLDRLRQEGILFSPDIVMVSINPLDLVDVDLGVKLTDSRFVRNLRLYQFTKGNRERERVRLEKVKVIETNSKEDSEQMKNAERIILEMKKVSGQVNAKLIVLILPEFDASSPNDNYQFVNFHEQIKKMGERNGFKVIDLWEAVKDDPDKSDLVLNQTDPHPSVRANELFAKYVTDVFDFETAINNASGKSVFKSVKIKKGLSLVNYKGVVSFDREGWVFFDEKYDLGVMSNPLKDADSRKINYMEDILKTAKILVHDGWVGAKIEHNVLVNDGKVIVPRKIYGFEVVGLSNVKAFWRNDGALESRVLNFDQYKVERNSDELVITLLDKRGYDFLKLELDVLAGQIDINEGKIVDIGQTIVLDGLISVSEDEKEVVFETKGKVGSLPKYVWLNDKMVAATLRVAGNTIVGQIEGRLNKDDKIQVYVKSQVFDESVLPIVFYF